MNSSPDLDLAIRTALQQGRARWPQITVAADRFSAHVHSMKTDQPMLAKYGADIYLAFACVQRDRSALALLQDQLLPAVDRHVVRMGMRPSLLDDLHQDLLLYLLCDPVPRLRSYRGRGSLLGWLRTVAIRRAFLLRRHGRELSVDEVAPELLCAGGPDPELQVLRRRFSPRVRRALEESLAALPRRHKVLLRRHYARRESIDVLARRYGVHRATVARWLAEVRAWLTRELQRRLDPPRLVAAEIGLLVEELRDDLCGIVGRFLQED
jgi:RNA polymerase sigma-70 factor (ECF subfamily)